MAPKLIVTLLAGLVLAGCGGGGVEAPASIDTYEGTYSGSWAALPNGGTCTLTVDKAGNITGPITENYEGPYTGEVIASIDLNGAANGFCAYNSGAPCPRMDRFNAHFTADGKGGLTGTGELYVNGDTGYRPLTFILKKTP